MRCLIALHHLSDLDRDIGHASGLGVASCPHRLPKSCHLVAPSADEYISCGLPSVLTRWPLQSFHVTSHVDGHRCKPSLLSDDVRPVTSSAAKLVTGSDTPGSVSLTGSSPRPRRMVVQISRRDGLIKPDVDRLTEGSLAAGSGQGRQQG